jgi:SAM-dependent methyltransferase
MRIVTSLEELDEILADCEQAAKISDDELRRVFQTFRMDFSAQLPPDPFSEGYATAQMELYKHIAGRSYQTANEESVFDLQSAIVRPFPYIGSCQVAGAHLGAIGFLLRTMQLSPGARVLDIGPGWGNTTLALAQLGFEVTALDIEPRFCDLIRERTSRMGLQVEVVNSDFFWIESVANRFDAIVTFECFHHCADHMRLLRAFSPALARGGHVYFGAEPITSAFPIPWGIRTDGESLWATRRNGWLELGFQPDYFHCALGKVGLIAETHVSADLPWISVWDARVSAPQTIQIAASDPRLGTQVGIRRNDTIQVQNGRAGYAVYGPYVRLAKGRFAARVYLRNSVVPTKGSAIIDVCANSGHQVFARASFESTSLVEGEPWMQIEFDLESAQQDVEVRLYSTGDFSGCIEGLELASLSHASTVQPSQEDPVYRTAASRQQKC